MLSARQLDTLAQGARDVRVSDACMAQAAELKGQVITEQVARVFLQPLVDALVATLPDAHLPRCLNELALRVQMHLAVAVRREAFGLREGVGSKPYVVSPVTVNLLLATFVNYVVFFQGGDPVLMAGDIDS